LRLTVGFGGEMRSLRIYLFHGVDRRGAGSAEERRVDWQEQGAGCGGVRLARRGARPPEEHWRWPGRGEAPLANGEDELVRSFFRNELILVLLTFV
jgi:hypothetical protein